MEDTYRRLDKLEDKIDDIRNNHISSIYRIINENRGMLKVLVPLIIGTLALVCGVYGILLLG